ncbi:YihY/virulence factor BrkB family protein [Streptomyces uncialis]|uniref:YihY/virulence factor BrkB family protein n=1 Tax=Streptomyces uncialis TaxID=1048205 RepID=UPI003800F4B0
MDWLKKIPGIGPYIGRLMDTHGWRAYERLEDVKWTQLAAAMTFLSFLALFPLITVAAAVAAATLDTQGQKKLEEKLSEQVPGISDQLDISSLVANAGTVGLVAGALLLLTGIGWVGSMRDCLRAVWKLPDIEENPVLRKVKDAVVLGGLGGAGLVSLAASALASSAVGWGARLLGVDDTGSSGALLQVIAFTVAVLADFLVLLYVLTLLPGVQPARRDLVIAGLMGAAGFELLKLLIGSYIRDIAGRSMYGAFGVPVALMLWINFTAKLLLYCASWTATRRQSTPSEAERPGVGEGSDGGKSDGAEPTGQGNGGAGAGRDARPSSA